MKRLIFNCLFLIPIVMLFSDCKKRETTEDNMEKTSSTRTLIANTTFSKTISSKENKIGNQISTNCSGAKEKMKEKEKKAEKKQEEDEETKKWREKLKNDEKKLLSYYHFPEWGGKVKSNVLIFNSNPNIFNLLEDLGYVITSSTQRSYYKSYLYCPYPFFYSEARFVNSEASGLDAPVFRLIISEFGNVIKARKGLCFQMTYAGAGGRLPNKCLKNIDIGDKCFTGRAKRPNFILFCRGNVVIHIFGDEDVDKIARKIDSLLQQQPNSAKESTSPNITFASSTGLIGQKIPIKIKDKEKVGRVRIFCSKGEVVFEGANLFYIPKRKRKNVIKIFYWLKEKIYKSKKIFDVSGNASINEEFSTKKKEIINNVKTLSDNILTKKRLSYSKEPEYKAVIEMGNAASETLLDMLDEVKGHEDEKDCPYHWLVLVSLLKKIREPRVMDYLVHLLDTDYWATAHSCIEQFTGHKFMESKTAKPTQEEIHMMNVKMKKWWKENRSRYIKEK